MLTSPEQVAALLEGGRIDGESLTVVLAANATRGEVASTLGPELELPPDVLENLDINVDYSAYGIVEVAGGVIAVETSGYADPSLDVLSALSNLGGLAAVARSNIQAHERFGCARGGVVLFDADEYMYIEREEASEVPEALRSLFESAWVDLDDSDQDGDGWAGVITAVAMAIEHTGVSVSSDDLARTRAVPPYPVRALTYP